MRPSGILLSSRVSLNAIKSMFLFQTMCLISSILPGNVTMFRKAILNPLLLGMELRVVKKLLLTGCSNKLQLINSLSYSLLSSSG